MAQSVQVSNLKISNESPLVIMGGLNVLENYDLAARVCEHFLKVTEKLNLGYIFKASFDKANRSSLFSYRGVGVKEGMAIFKKLKQELMAVITLLTLEMFVMAYFWLVKKEKMKVIF